MKEKLMRVLPYAFWGILTTGLNYLVFAVLYMGPLHISASAANIVASAVGMGTSFLANKRFVFRSPDWSFRVLLKEGSAFLSVRLFSFCVEQGGVMLAEWLGAGKWVLLTLWTLRIDGMIPAKMVMSFTGFVINYLLCTFAVFRTKQS